MFRLTVALSATLFGTLYAFGDPARRPAEVTRAEPMTFNIEATALESEIQIAAFQEAPGISDAQAVEIALAKGAEIREARLAAPLQSVAFVKQMSADDAALWYVTGTRVNLRNGPGTSNAVVGQVSYGMEARVLSSRDGWYEIQLADASETGWIYSKFLQDQRGN